MNTFLDTPTALCVISLQQITSLYENRIPGNVRHEISQYW